MSAIKEINLHGYTIEIIQDEHSESPDHWSNDDAFIVYDHRQFHIEKKGFNPDEIFEHIEQTKTFFYDGYWIFPVYAYIHSGVSLSLGKTVYPFTCQWDVSFKGFALVKRQKGWSYHKKQAEKIAKSIVNEWNQYLSGDVYGYQIKQDDNIIESCWGFYGLKDCEQQAIDLVNHLALKTTI